MQICRVRILPLPLCNCVFSFFRDLDTIGTKRALRSHVLERHWHLIFNDCILRSGGYSLLLFSWSACSAMYEPLCRPKYCSHFYPVFVFPRQSSHTPLLEEESIFILLLGGKNRQNGRTLSQKPLASTETGGFSFLICALHMWVNNQITRNGRMPPITVLVHLEGHRSEIVEPLHVAALCSLTRPILHLSI